MPSKKCETGTENKCLSYTYPVTTVTKELKDGWKNYDIPTCRIRDEQKTHCAELPQRAAVKRPFTANRTQ